MPFTIIHTVAALPLKWLFPRSLSLTGLIAGAIAPDLLYFLELTPMHRSFSHSWPGLFIFCLPAGLLFAFAFHWLIKQDLLASLPSPFDRRFSGLARSPFRPSGRRAWFILLLSIIAGILTHFLWDSFTHNRGIISGWIPFLREDVHVLGRWVSVARIAKFTSNAVGLSILAWVAWNGHFLPPPVKAHPRTQAGERPDDQSIPSANMIVTDTSRESAGRSLHAPPARTPREKLLFWLGTGSFATLFALAAVWLHLTLLPDRLATPTLTFGLAGFAGFFWAIVGLRLIRLALFRTPETAIPEKT